MLERTSAWLASKGIDTPRLDAELLIGAVLGLERLQLYLAFDRPFTADELDRLRPLVRRRGQREPMAWILGERGFHAIDLKVHPGVLVPRPDTETLVEAALSYLDPDADEPVYIADVGCGTGAVGLAIAAARPSVRLYAVDVSPEALQNTRENVAELALQDRVGVLTGDHEDPLAPVPQGRPIDWVVSNPPYIPSGDIDALMPEVSQHEPRLALDGGPDGLDIVRRLVRSAARRVRRGMLLEIGQGQASQTAELLRDAGFEGVKTWTDLGGIERVVGGLRAG